MDPRHLIIATCEVESVSWSLEGAMWFLHVNHHDREPSKIVVVAMGSSGIPEKQKLSRGALRTGLTKDSNLRKMVVHVSLFNFRA